jgi:hypothetical protein
MKKIKLFCLKGGLELGNKRSMDTVHGKHLYFSFGKLNGKQFCDLNKYLNIFNSRRALCPLGKDGVYPDRAQVG